MLSQVKLIAEPWDVGPGGYQVGNFPVLWSEWNGIYRDAMRDFWRGEAGVDEFASRLTGSSDLYEDDGRHPFASINFITAHDGFTLRDLVSYNEKHNEANLEDNRDGTDDNRSWNCGVEGATDDPEINALRDAPAAQLPRHAVPLPGHADAARRRRVRPHPGRQQQRLVPGQRDLLVRLGAATRRRRALLEFTQRLIALRREHPVFRRRQFLHGTEPEGSGLPDVWWFRPDGRRDDQARLGRRRRTSLGMFLNGEEIAAPGEHGERIVDDSFLLLFNAQPRGRGRSRCRRARFGAQLDAASCAPTTRTAAGRRCGRAARATLGVARARDRAAPRDDVTELRATYRLQLGRRLRLRGRRASSCPTCASSASATSTCRRRSRRARARRTATTSSTRRAISEELGGERGVRRAGARGARGRAWG